MADRSVRVVVSANTAPFNTAMTGASRSAASLRTGLGTAATAVRGLGAVLAGGAILGGLGAIVTAGNEYTANVNKWGVITGATNAQMDKMRDTARALGNDMDLPKATAQDAADAMLELAKSGFSVDESMQAARSTVILATAAETGIGEAAMMASDMMQQFGLKASETARVTDILTNAANASSISIGDVYNSMKYVGPVAKSVGVSMADTATAIAMLGNAGIKADSAGTKLSGVIASLAAPSGPAADAIKTLGINAFDAQGKFVGLRAITEQLAKARGTLTDAQYTGAVADAFGKDNLAGLVALAEQGPAAFDKMSEAVNREGSALELAKANTKGLGGAMAMLQSQLANLGMEVYQALAPALETVTGHLATLVNTVAPMVGPAFDKAADAAKGFAGLVHGAFDMLAPALKPLIAGAGALASAFAALPGPVQASALALGALVLYRSKITDLGTRVGGMGSSLRAAGTAAGSATATVSGMTAQLGRLGGSIQVIGQRVPVIGRMQESFLGAAGGAQRFGRTAGIASAATTGLKAAGSGLMGLMGGPLGLALAGATVGLGLLADQQAKAAQKAQEHADRTARFKEVLAQSNGEIDNNVRMQLAMETAQQKVGKSNENVIQTAEKLGISYGLLNGAILGQDSAYEGLRQRLQGIVSEHTTVAETQTEVAGTGAAVRVSQDETAKSANNLLKQLDPLRDSFAKAREEQAAMAEAQRNATPYTSDLTEALKKLGDSSGKADEKLNALKLSIDILSGKQPDATQAVKMTEDAIRELGKSADGARRSGEQWGNHLLDATGRLSRLTDEGKNADDAFGRLADAGLLKAQAAFDQVRESGGSLEDALQSAGSEVASYREQLVKAAVDAGFSREGAEKLAGAMRLIPEQVDTAIKLSGKDEVTQELAGVQQALADVPDGKNLTVDALTEDARAKLAEFGIETEWLPEEKKFRIVGDNAVAMMMLQNVTEYAVPDKRVTVEAPTERALGQLETIAGQVRGLKDRTLQIEAPDGPAIQSLAAIGFNVENLPDKKVQITVPSTDPTKNAQLIDEAVKAVREKKEVTVDIPTAGPQGQAMSIQRTINGISGKTVTVTVKRVETTEKRADGGVDEAFAQGGFSGILGRSAHTPSKPREDHQAQVATAGTNRLWAEPETGGEAYIPLSVHKRGRSKAITEDVVSRFGGEVSWTPTVRQSAGGGPSTAALEQALTRLGQRLEQLGSARSGGTTINLNGAQQTSAEQARMVARELAWVGVR